jgi:hypothetical protein
VKKWALGFPGEESWLGFDLPGSTRNRSIGMEGWRLTDRVAAQVGA